LGSIANYFRKYSSASSGGLNKHQDSSNSSRISSTTSKTHNFFKGDKGVIAEIDQFMQETDAIAGLNMEKPKPKIMGRPNSAQIGSGPAIPLKLKTLDF